MVEKEDKILKSSEVAKRLRVSERTVRRYIQKKILPAIHLHNRQWLIKESELLIYIENKKKKLKQKND